ncbi:MAG: glycosyltransferase [Actinobacteria bacterium]|nr:glycosyltransferase [Actinomycetota bacterium]
MHVLFATAEIEPIVSTGGLGAASFGLVNALRRAGVEVTVVLPGYAGYELSDETVMPLVVPGWVGTARARVGTHEAVGALALIEAPSIERPHPYVDPQTAQGWLDNDHRFFAWSAGVAALAHELRPDVVHVNDWHAAATLSYLDESFASVLSIHNLAHQGWGDRGWLRALGGRSGAYSERGAVNALAGAIRLADRIVAVSPTYADEIRTFEGGIGLDGLLSERGDAVLGILNGIDTDDWNPASDPALVANYSAEALEPRPQNQAALLGELGLDARPGPLVVSVSRFDAQKGIDMIPAVSHLLAGTPARFAFLGSGDRSTEAALASVAAWNPGRIAFRQGYDASLAHRMFAAGDFAIVPSRFEPCGLTQMQAMRYGAVPIVSNVGGLHDTVIDVDAEPRTGLGIVLREVSGAGLVDGVHRAARLFSKPAAYRRTQARGLARDWSWDGPAVRYQQLYEGLMSGR